MEEGKKLSKRLYLILILGFTLYQLFNTVYLDITAEKLSNKNFTYDYKKKYKEDFTIPVDIYCMMGDTTINYIGENSSGVISSTMLNDTNHKKQYNEIKNNKTYKKDYYTNELSISDNKLNKIDNNFEKLNITPTNGVAVLNPKNTKDKIALYLVKYFTYVFIIIILIVSR